MYASPILKCWRHLSCMRCTFSVALWNGTFSFCQPLLLAVFPKDQTHTIIYKRLSYDHGDVNIVFIAFQFATFIENQDLKRSNNQ